MYNYQADTRCYAGTNEFYRYGHKAQEKVQQYLTANAAGYISIPADGGHYWSIGTSEGKYGEYAKISETFFSVNRGGYVYAKAGTEKGDVLIRFIQKMLDDMKAANTARCQTEEEEDA